jgi:hypothetical protein
MTIWSDARLRQLFERYRLRYWPRSRRLKQFRIENRSLGDQGDMGLCEFETRMLTVDLSAHTSDREVRATVLHEMIHAVIGKGKGGHHAPFWTQLEYLLSRRAPVTIGFPELGERGKFLQVIQPRFRRCRRLFRPVHLRHQRQLQRIERDRVIPGFPRVTVGEPIRGAELLKWLQQEAKDAGAFAPSPAPYSDNAQAIERRARGQGQKPIRIRLRGRAGAAHRRRARSTRSPRPRSPLF